MSDTICRKCGKPNPPEALRCKCGCLLREQKYDDCHFFNDTACPHINDPDMQQVIKAIYVEDNCGDKKVVYAAKQVNKLRCGICKVFKPRE